MQNEEKKTPTHFLPSPHITFLPENKTVSLSSPVVSDKTHEGLPGSLLDYALKNDIFIDHACGGVGACSTCHVILVNGFSHCSPATEAEEDQLDKAPGLTPQSRLACQCRPQGSGSIEVLIPKWNRNLARE